MNVSSGIKGPNYEPNSANNGKNSFDFNAQAGYKPYVVKGLVARVKPWNPEDDFSQPGTLFRQVFDDRQRTITINNLASSIKGIKQDIRERLVKMFSKADGELGSRLGQ